MNLAKKIYQRLQELPEPAQAEILDFIEFIDRKKNFHSEAEWKHFSVSSAMRGMENEPLPEYTASDLKERFT